jgi:hypothetical protein
MEHESVERPETVKNKSQQTKGGSEVDERTMGWLMAVCGG